MLGKLRSGKTTVSGFVQEFVKEKYGIELISKPLATPIYEEAKAIYAKHGLIWRKNRRLLEGIGEALNEDYPGGDKIVELYDASFNSKEHIFVEDCRRKTQADYFRSIGAILIRVWADPKVRKLRCKPGEWAEGHVTDTELDDYPVNLEIYNNRDGLQALRDQVYEKAGNLLEIMLENYGESKTKSSMS